MAKLLRQNIGGVDYTMAGCALTGVCASAASDFIKAVTLSDGDTASDGMTIACTFANGNSAGTAPDTLTIYSSDQVNYYSDTELTQPFTLAPSGCYTIEYTGTGNAYTYQSYPIIVVGNVSGPLCDTRGKPAGGAVWSAGDIVTLLCTGGKFLALNVVMSSLVSSNAFPASSKAVLEGIAKAKYYYNATASLSQSGWYRIAQLGARHLGQTLTIELCSSFNYAFSGSHIINVTFGWYGAVVLDTAYDPTGVFDKLQVCLNNNEAGTVGIYVHYSQNAENMVYANISTCTVSSVKIENFEHDNLSWDNALEYALSTRTSSGGIATRADLVNYSKQLLNMNCDSFGYTSGQSVNISDLVDLVCNTYGANSFYSIKFTWDDSKNFMITTTDGNILLSSGATIIGYFELNYERRTNTLFYISAQGIVSTILLFRANEATMASSVRQLTNT